MKTNNNALLTKFYNEANEALYISDAKIGFRLKHLRERMGYSQSELARRARISRSSIVRYENNTLLPRKQTIEKILTALYVDVTLFTSGKNDDEFIENCSRYYSNLAENNIYIFRQEIESRLDKHYIYKCNKENIILSDKVMAFLKANILAAFEVLDILPHDKDQS